jgi:hypothetical protein
MRPAHGNSRSEVVRAGYLNFQSRVSPVPTFSSGVWPSCNHFGCRLSYIQFSIVELVFSLDFGPAPSGVIFYVATFEIVSGVNRPICGAEDTKVSCAGSRAHQGDP